MEIVVALLDAIAWPITILILALLFRSELRAGLKRLSYIKYRDTELKFEADLKKLEKKALLLPEANQDKVLNSIESSEYARMIRLAEASPRAAIFEAWIKVEEATKKVAEAHGIEHRGAYRTMRLLREKEVVNVGLDLYDELRVLRNRAVHLPEFAIEIDEAERYILLALGLAMRLQEAATQEVYLEEVDIRGGEGGISPGGDAKVKGGKGQGVRSPDRYLF